MRVYGIPNCDIVKKALAWLKENEIVFDFHDFKKEGITELKLKEWLKTISLEDVLNKKSIAFRNLTEAEKKFTAVKASSIKLMQNNTNLIKRPVIETAGTIFHGFNEAAYTNAFLKK